MSENTPGTRPVTGIGKGFYCMATAYGNLPAPLYAGAAMFSKPFFASSGRFGRSVSRAWLRPAVWGDTAGERPCAQRSPGIGGPGGVAAAQERHQCAPKLTPTSYSCRLPGPPASARPAELKLTRVSYSARTCLPGIRTPAAAESDVSVIFAKRNGAGLWPAAGPPRPPSREARPRSLPGRPGPPVLRRAARAAAATAVSTRRAASPWKRPPEPGLATLARGAEPRIPLGRPIHHTRPFPTTPAGGLTLPSAGSKTRTSGRTGVVRGCPTN